jgi:hypothetical protein
VQNSAPAGTFITRVSAIDPNGLNFTWSIPDTALQRFTINPITGDIFTSRNLTRQFVKRFELSRSVIEFLVRATNAAGLTCDSLVRVTILTTPVPQVIVAVYNGTNGTSSSSPSFSSSSYYFTLSSCSSGGTVGTVTASGSSNSYTITTSSSFSVSSAGLITLTGSISSGTNYSFTLQASNSFGTSTTTVYVYSSCSYTGSSTSTCNCGSSIYCILNVIYNPNYCGTSSSSSTSAPTWSSSTYPITISSCSSGSAVGTLTANNSPTSYSINGNSNYAISNSGVITASATIAAGTQSFVVGASNSAGTAYTLVTITATCTASTSSASGIPSFSQTVYR